MTTASIDLPNGATVPVPVVNDVNTPDEIQAMGTDHLKELIDLEDSYWWHRAKRELVLSLVKEHFPAPGRVLEGGIGSSRTLIELQKCGYKVAGLDIMPEAVAHAHARGLDDVQEHNLMEPWPVEPQSLNAVLLLDVIEHISDPIRVLEHATSALAPGGGVIITVPAYQWLYGDWDRELGHYRRYSRYDFKRQVSKAGLTIEKLGFWNSFTLPPAMAIRSYQKCFPKDRPASFPRVSPTTNQLLGWMAAKERQLMKYITVPCGLSLVGVCKK